MIKNYYKQSYRQRPQQHQIPRIHISPKPMQIEAENWNSHCRNGTLKTLLRGHPRASHASVVSRAYLQEGVVP